MRQLTKPDPVPSIYGMRAGGHNALRPRRTTSVLQSHTAPPPMSHLAGSSFPPVDDAWNRYLDNVAARSTKSAQQCQVRGEPPRVAFCTAGAARTFASPLAFSSWMYNLVAASGARDEGRYLFLLLKAGDTDKWGGAGHTFYSHKETEIPGLQARLATPWLATRLAESVIVNGSGMPDTLQQRLDGVVPSSDLWKSYRNDRCGEFYNVNERNELEYFLAVSWCHAAIARQEATAGEAFGRVVFTRPDLYFHTPITPWCGWSDHVRLGCFLDHVLPCDAFWTAPRRFFDAFRDLAGVHRDCSPSEAERNKIHLLHKKSFDCCARQEVVLDLVGRGLHRSRNGTSAVAHVNVGLEDRQAALIFRAAQAVCEISLSYLYDRRSPMFHTYAMTRSEPEHGQGPTLVPRLGLKLRDIFSLPNRTISMRDHELASCHRALWARPCPGRASRPGTHISGDEYDCYAMKQRVVADLPVRAGGV